MYLIKFNKILKEKVWGGVAFKEKLDIELPKEALYGESWEISCRNQEISVVENGEFKEKSLEELLFTYGERLVGREVYEKYGDKFPLLIKYLDINDKLSVQVHPDDSYALEHENDFGKTECWYVIEASPDAKLILGLKEGITKDRFREKIQNKDFKDLFNEVKVKKGDFININPGLVHASLEGSILICEPQQNSDTTYRIYDFDRIVDGEKRELHLDKAMDVINYSQRAIVSSEENRNKTNVDGNIVEMLCINEYFKVNRLIIKSPYSEEKSNNFGIFSILEGNGVFIVKGIIYHVKKGETYFLPPNLQLIISGDLEILKTYI